MLPDAACREMDNLRMGSGDVGIVAYRMYAFSGNGIQDVLRTPSGRWMLQKERQLKVDKGKGTCLYQAAGTGLTG